MDATAERSGNEAESEALLGRVQDYLECRAHRGTPEALLASAWTRFFGFWSGPIEGMVRY
jgi:hypothetical protein